METLLWITKQQVMIIIYAIILTAFVLERIEIIKERKVKRMKINNALKYIFKIKSNWINANTSQANVLCGLDFMQRVFDKGVADAIQVARTEPESVEEYMNKIHDELLGLCGTQSAEILLDEVFNA